MTKNELHKLIRECLNEVTNNLNEISLPPGFSSSDLRSLDVFAGVTDEAEPEELTEDDEKLLGAPVSDFPDDELKSYLKRVVGEPAINKKTGLPKLDKTGKPKFVSGKLATDKFKYPYVHRSNIIDGSGNPIDPEKLKTLIKVRPTKLLKSNTKMQKSGGNKFKFYDISLPALRGLIVDESSNELKIVSTCPGAGGCKVYCYAKKGGYVQYKDVSMIQTRMVNFLLNDYQGFKSMLIGELNTLLGMRSSKKIVLRWHDSGDFMSPKYLQMAFDIARATPNVMHYAYTKMVGMVSAANKPKNFVFNFSQGAIAPEEKLIQIGDKQSIVVPKPLFKDLMHKDTDLGKWVYNSDKDKETLKRKMSLKYNIPEDSIITYDEMMNIPYDQEVDTEPMYNVIVAAGEGDTSAMRKDVIGTYLLIH
jgi:hypothetical protein